MAEIALERLVVKQSYFVPVKANQLITTILTELEKCDTSYFGIRPWSIYEEHGNCFTIGRSFRWIYVDTKSSYNPDKEEVKKLSNEYEKAGIKADLEMTKGVAGSVPMTLHMRIIRSTDESCEVEVECEPILYNKIQSFRHYEIKELDIQTANLVCRRFLRDIFVGGLRSTPISETRPSIPEKVNFLLINDVNSRAITEKLTELIEGATVDILVFGWIGTIYLNKLRELKTRGVEIKVITGNIKAIRQDPMQKEKERAMKELISIIGKDHISIKPEFHGRAIVIDNKALIGSMDLDSYSLTGTRIELATYTEDPELVRRLRSYFNRIFTPLKNEEEKKELNDIKQT